ncbi:MalY/PatB family protein [Ornithinibacillus sp. 4-3]|uniref:cysteine-S-conjugate beta-lyase n=1 Tax=Ornithinibacillus sp. 4-3 TaxID=3231488 RepID=A0AB39HMC8_9BACI
MSIFDAVHERKNTKSVKWDQLEAIFGTNDVLPMWVADMDFKAPEAVNEALIERAKHGIYGYTVMDAGVKDSILNWLKDRHQWEINEEWLSFSPGVVTSLHIAVQAFTNPGDNIIIQTPVYTPFYNVIETHERNVVKNPLVFKDNSYHIDFEDFEQKIVDNKVKAFISCSPHNPACRVWTKEELEKMAEICLKHDVLIISDEIHADLVYPNVRHIPIASLSEEIANQTITCMSPTKTFNLAGLQASYIVTPDAEKKKAIDQHLQKQSIDRLNTMGNIALEAAYTHGKEWLDELISILEGHKNYIKEMLETNTKELKVVDTEGTYLLWVDCSGLEMDADELKKFMIEKAKVGLNAGAGYGEEGNQFMRINMACPRATIEEGVKRIIDAVNSR